MVKRMNENEANKASFCVGKTKIVFHTKDLKVVKI